MRGRSTRQTEQRKTIYAIVAAVKSHPTADRIYDAARRRLPAISLGTVYRNLQVLESEGKIRALNFGGRATRYDADLSDHYHFLCRGCGAIFDVEKPDGSDAHVGTLLRRRGFRATGHRLEFHGLCGACQKPARGRGMRKIKATI